MSDPVVALRLQDLSMFPFSLDFAVWVCYNFSVKYLVI